MKVVTRTMPCLLVGVPGSWQSSFFAQVPEHEDSLSACKDGLKSCNRSELTDAASHSITVSVHQHNLADCSSNDKSRDHVQLTHLETIILMRAEGQLTCIPRNFVKSAAETGRPI